MNTQLFDTPGPRARRRLAWWNAAFGVLFAALGVFVIWSLNEAGQFNPAYWAPFLDPGIIKALLRGLVATLRAAFYAIIFGLVIGAILAIGRMSSKAWIRLPTIVVIEFFRSLPPLLLVLFLFLACTFAFGRLGSFLTAFVPAQVASFLGMDQMDRLGPMVLALALYQGAILAEIFRAGLLALPRGQAEAGYSIGLTKAAVLRYILAPQAIRIMLPTTVSELIILLKLTALGYIISYQELLRTGRLITASYNNIIPTALVMLAIYVLLNMAIARLARWMQERQEHRYGALAPSQVTVAHAA
jgi:glutamate transport system permease protein